MTLCLMEHTVLNNSYKNIYTHSKLSVAQKKSYEILIILHKKVFLKTR